MVPWELVIPQVASVGNGVMIGTTVETVPPWGGEVHPATIRTRTVRHAIERTKELFIRATPLFM